MTSNQIEAWALRSIQAAIDHQNCEDSLVEMKREWPTDHHKAARRIAAHANAAGGQPILWLIGVDEKGGMVTGADQNSFSDWWAQVRKHFESLAPHLRDLAVHCHGTSVAALHFETDRAPFLVNNPVGGTISWEVPWREGARTRTATRSDLIRMLTPQSPPPEIEVLEGWLRLSHLRDRTTDAWELVLELYIVPLSPAAVVFPFHHCDVEVAGPFCYQFSLPKTIIGGRSSASFGTKTTSFATSSSPTEASIAQPRSASEG